MFVLLIKNPFIGQMTAAWPESSLSVLILGSGFLPEQIIAKRLKMPVN